MRVAIQFLLVVAITGCVSGPPDSWGPLAVMTTDMGMDARTEGVLVLTDRCAFIERDGERELLVWPSQQTKWLAGSSAVSFSRRTGEVVELRTGQRMVLGGGGSSLAEDGLTGEQWADGIPWVAAPDPSCLIDVRWLVSDILSE